MGLVGSDGADKDGGGGGGASLAAKGVKSEMAAGWANGAFAAAGEDKGALRRMSATMPFISRRSPAI